MQNILISYKGNFGIPL